MKISEVDILIVPGIGNSGPGHWQQRWKERMPTARAVVQDDWDNPDMEAWTSRLLEAVLYATRPVVLVGHSLGVHAIVHVASRLTDTKVKGAFLVAPPDLDLIAPDYPRSPASSRFPPRRFPSPPLSSDRRMMRCAARSAPRTLRSTGGLNFTMPVTSGHLNAASGHGPWPEGMLMFARFMQRLGK